MMKYSFHPHLSHAFFQQRFTTVGEKCFKFFIVNFKIENAKNVYVKNFAICVSDKKETQERLGLSE